MRAFVERGDAWQRLMFFKTRNNKREEVIMIRAIKFTTILVVLSLFMVPWANAGDLPEGYLYGRWVVDEQNCSSPDSEYFVFRENGTFESTRAGKAEIVGFWGFNEGILELDMVTSPAFFDDIHRALAGFEGEFNYYHIRMVIFNTSDKRFEAFGVLGNEVKRAIAVRCR